MTTGTIFERSRKSEPFHVQSDDGHVVGPVGAKQPILAGPNRGINAGSTFCGAQVVPFAQNLPAPLH